jgi:hypothetical protein
MDLSRPEFSYVLLIIPLLFAAVVFIQGMIKSATREQDGPVAIGFGVFLFFLIGAAWFFFIR